MEFTQKRLRSGTRSSGRQSSIEGYELEDSLFLFGDLPDRSGMIALTP
jgi:hypothetical protein